jgi:hypothetical protein
MAGQSSARQHWASPIFLSCQPPLRPPLSWTPQLLKGIGKYFAEAGEPATEARVQAFLQAPHDDRGSPWVTAAAGAAVLGTIAYRRPRAAALFAGAVALTTAPYLGFMLVTVNRFGKVGCELGAQGVARRGRALGAPLSPARPATHQHWC